MKMTTEVPNYLWSRVVREIDGNRCVYCGRTEKLEAHHIIPRHIDKGKELDVNNGVTLCHECHFAITWGGVKAIRSFIEDYRERNVVSAETIQEIASRYRNERAKSHLRRIPLDLRIEGYERLREHAENGGESINGYIKRVVSEAIDREKLGATPGDTKPGTH